jgi:hypothetical protein
VGVFTQHHHEINRNEVKVQVSGAKLEINLILKISARRYPSTCLRQGFGRQASSRQVFTAELDEASGRAGKRIYLIN